MLHKPRKPMDCDRVDGALQLSIEKRVICSSAKLRTYHVEQVRISRTTSADDNCRVALYSIQSEFRNPKATGEVTFPVFVFHKPSALHQKIAAPSPT